jgi:hypothetical protein
LKTAREELDIINAYEETGSLRAATALCGTTHKTVKRVMARREHGQCPGRRRVPQPDVAEPFTDLIYQKVKSTDGRITAKRLLPVAWAAGYGGSARTFRRAVAAQKALWRKHRRVYRPWVPEPGQHLLIDYGTVTGGPNTGLKIFTAVLAWSRWRFGKCRRGRLNPIRARYRPKSPTGPGELSARQLAVDGRGGQPARGRVTPHAGPPFTFHPRQAFVSSLPLPVVAG